MQINLIDFHSCDLKAFLKTLSFIEQRLIEVLFVVDSAVPTKHIRILLIKLLNLKPETKNIPYVHKRIPSFKTLKKTLEDMQKLGLVSYRETPEERTLGLWSLRPAFFEYLKEKGFKA